MAIVHGTTLKFSFLSEFLFILSVKMNSTATAISFALWYADEAWSFIVKEEETLKIRSETKELSRSVDELRAAGKE
jgi:hypothetical protein